ncbi:hypothetical protein [Fulvivirga lutea]|uniref:Uncharacterized protein n=1 Tax=Fulvivirga lutea TaxID=2810512 RepID=A0A974WIV8_9BACT|nr:hypothetical protein [Fulvivirga lutea]QSE99000.1 hypothetical protein JR347_07915 [Fulvivirga lutea]
MEVYQVKERRELLFFKWLKLIAFWLAAWWGIWGLLFIVAYTKTRRTGFSGINEENNRQFIADHWDVITTTIPWLAVAVVAYYVISTAWFDKIDRFEFDDEKEELRMFCYGYFTHLPGNVFIPYRNLSSELYTDSNFVYGDFIVLKIKRSSHTEARITGSSSHWQKLPNTIHRVHEKIESITLHNIL